jgi:DNA-binding MarR family transcriptional regulator
MNEADLAKDFLEVIPRAMRIIRKEMRALAPADLTVPQFRILAYISRGKATNRDIAEFIGCSAPAMSRMISSLGRKGMVTTVRDSMDRRQVSLELTEAGQRQFRSMRKSAEVHFKQHFRQLPPEEQAALYQGFRVLSGLLPIKEENHLK